MLALLPLVLLPQGAHRELPTPDQLRGPTYPPLSFDGIPAQRAIRKEGDKVVLTLTFSKPPAKPTALRLKELTLNLYEPVAPLPLTIDLVPGQPKTVSIAFPPAVAGLGAVDYVCKHVTDGKEGVEEEYGELPTGDPQVDVDATKDGYVFEIQNGSENRTMAFRVNGLTIKERPVPSAVGKALTLKPRETATLSGLSVPKRKNGSPMPYELDYAYRLLPNRVWRKSSQDGALEGS